MEGDVGGADIIENGNVNTEEKLNNNGKVLNGFDVDVEEGEEGEPDTMENPGFVNTALDKIGDADPYGFGEPVIERKAYSNPELRDMVDPRHGGYDVDTPRELTEDEYQEFLEDSECLVENGDVEPLAQNVDEAHGDVDINEPHGDVDEPIEEINELGLKKLAPNMGDISPLDEYPPLGGAFPGMSDAQTLADPDCLSVGSEMDEPREGSPEPDMCYPPHVPECLDPPSSDEDDLMPADTADSIENGLNDSVEREAVVELRNRSKAKVIAFIYLINFNRPLVRLFRDSAFQRLNV